jgi:hypothetical protein
MLQSLKLSARACRPADLCGLRNTVSLTGSTLSGAVGDSGLLVVYCPSLIFLDAISIPTIAEYCG